MNLFENEYASLEYTRKTNTLFLHWRKYSPSKAFREIMERLYLELVKRKIERILCDNTHLKIVAPEDQQWILKVWLPYFTKPHACFKTLAFIEPEDLFGKLSCQNLSKGIVANFEHIVLQEFKTKEKALHWLSDIGHASSAHLSKPKSISLTT